MTETSAISQESVIGPDSIADYFGYASRWLSTLDGESIHYLDEGDSGKPPVILLHGSAIGITAAANYYLTIPALTKAGHRALAPDLYGYGWTVPTPAQDATLFNQERQVMRFMDALHVERAYLIGNSLGGRLSTRLAMQFPDRFLGNIVIGTGGAVWKPGPRAPYLLTSKEEMAVPTREMVLEAMRRLVSNPEVLCDSLIEFRTRMALRPGEAERFLISTRHRNASAKAAGFDEAKAKACLVPTLFVYGREDAISPPENALAGAEACPNADLVVFGHCGHWTMIERADDFNRLMLRFLDGYAQEIAAPPVRSHDLRGAGIALSGQPDR